MAFTRVKPPGWSTNEKLTSVQINTLDIDHANALDKTGDAIDGGTIEVNAGGEIVLNTAAAIQVSATGSISIDIASGIKSNAVGAIELGNGNDWIKFASRPRSVKFGVADVFTLGAPADFDFSVGYWLQTTSIGSSGFFAIRPPDGATLVSVSVSFTTSTDWTVVPSVFPKLEIIRMDGTTLATSDLLSTGTFTYAGEALGTWNNAAVKTLTLTCDQNNTGLLASGYAYFGKLTDSIGGTATTKRNRYFVVTTTYAITEQRYPQ